MNELLPCPFCGGHDIRVADVCSVTFACGCMDCGASAGVASSEAEAIEAWNTRADDYRQAAEYWQRMYEEKFAERTCRMSPSDYYPCAEDDRMRLSMRMWTCSECEADHVGIKPNYCPNCGARVTPKNSETTPKVVRE